MKKCASCTKDLPDAALHCVFCGAKQAPAPATAGGMAKTVMGAYSASDMIEHLKQQGGAPPPGAPRPAPAAPPPHGTAPPHAPHRSAPAAPHGAAPPHRPAPAAPPQAFAATQAQPASSAPASPRSAPSPSQPPPQAPPVVASAANAKTMFAPSTAPQGGFAGGPQPGVLGTAPHGGSAGAHHGGFGPHGGQPGPHGGQSGPHSGQPGAFPGPHGGHAGGFGPPAGQPGAFGAGHPSAPAGAFGSSAGFGAPMPSSHPVGTSPSHVSSVPLQAPQPVAPAAPIPAPANPYLAASAARAARPIEPWQHALRLMMFVWGGVLLAAFVTPLATDPLVFNWDLIADAEGTAKLPPLIMAAVGLLSIAIAAIPMAAAPRGMLAALLGLAGVIAPIALAGMPPWHALLPLAGAIVVIPNLLAREEYVDATVPRVLITFGVAASLVPWLLPRDGSLPLVELFKLAIEAPGSLKVIVLLTLGPIAILVLSLLAWMPAPATGGAKLFAWLLILWPLVTHVTVLVLAGNLGDTVAGRPYEAVIAWAAGLGAAGGGDAGMFGMMGLSLGVAYAVLIGYGLATVIGKKLE